MAEQDTLEFTYQHSELGDIVVAVTYPVGQALTALQALHDAGSDTTLSSVMVELAKDDESISNYLATSGLDIDYNYDEG